MTGELLAAHTTVGTVSAALLRRVARAACTASGHRFALVADDVQLLVHACSPWPVKTLTRDCAPYLQPGPPSSLQGGDGHEEIHVIVDASLAAQLHTCLTRSGENAQGASHPLDLQHPGGTAVAGRLELPGAPPSDGHPPGFVLWDQSCPSTSYVVLPDESSASGRSLLRAGRAVAARLLLHAGWQPVHAAAFVTTAGAVLLTGARGSGKTTALVHVLTAGGTALLANSRVLVGGSRAAPIVRALPASVALRRPTLDLVPQLRTLAVPTARPHWETQVSPLGVPETRLLVPPRALAEVLGVDVVPLAPLRAVIEVVRHPEGRPSRWRLLRTEERGALLRAACRFDWFRDEPHEQLRASTGLAETASTARSSGSDWAQAMTAARFERGDAATGSLLACVRQVLR